MLQGKMSRLAIDDLYEGFLEHVAQVRLRYVAHYADHL